MQQSLHWHKLRKIHIRLFKNVPAREMRITVPTLLTIMRIVLVPFIIGCMFMQHWGAAFILFFLATITDFLDGNLARCWNEKTFLGACMDPIADKLLLISFFATLAFIETPLFTIPRWFVLLVLLKESIVIFGATFILGSGRHLDVQPTILGKLTTVVQMVFILWLFACYYFHWMPVKTYGTMLGIMLLMVFLSFIQYLRIGMKQFGATTI